MSEEPKIKMDRELEFWLEEMTLQLRSMAAARGLASKDAVRLQAERDDAIKTLRQICEHHGDNDWPDSLHLSDIIDKHLGDYLG